MENITTTDLSKFGSRELKMAADLLNEVVKNGLPDNFNDDGLTIMFNTHSGYVFLTNSDYEVAMINGEELAIFYTCPVCGHEGFLNEMNHGEDDKECQEYLESIGFKKELD